MPNVVSIVRAIARKALPRPARYALVRIYFSLENVRKKSMERRFARRSSALSDFQPLLPPQSFSDGPILMVNDGLASGGVERQIVNSLQVMGQRRDRVFGLLCLRLGSDADLDFFKPALADFPGIVRNAMSSTEAARALAGVFPPSSLKRMDAAIGWMPVDVREHIRCLAAEFATLKPSIVHAWQDGPGLPATYAARLIGVPRIMLSTRNLRPTNFFWYRPYMVHAHREIAQCPEIILINNSDAGAADYAGWLGIPPSRYVVKRNGLDTATIQRAGPEAVAALRTQLGIPDGSPVVGSIFRFFEEKRPLLWIEAVAEVAKRRPDCHFVIFGTGPLQRTLEEAARSHGIAERFHCPGTIGNAATGLTLFDVFLLTSKFEGTPNVVLEASMVGVPVVATEAGGTREAIADGVTGYLVDPPEPAAIAGCIVQVLSDEEWRTRGGREGPAFVEERVGLKRMIAQTLELYGLPPG
jgi:glycosyltransferase involved in cell wall biosynthesis